jgi:hypothetical protein
MGVQGKPLLGTFRRDVGDNFRKSNQPLPCCVVLAVTSLMWLRTIMNYQGVSHFTFISMFACSWTHAVVCVLQWVASKIVDVHLGRWNDAWLSLYSTATACP